MAKTIKIEKDKVIFSVENEFNGEKETITLSNRYAILLRDRWSLLYKALKQYFIDNGKRGCYIGERKDIDGHVYDIYDLTKVFPNVSFKENDFSNFSLI